MQFIDLSAQYKKLEQNIRSRIDTVLSHGQYIMGPEVKELEQQLEHFTGSKNAITCASGTDALTLSLRALDIGPGDEVVTSAFSFFATAEAICQVGAKPVLVDIESDYFNINSSLIRQAITKNTKAIMPVSLFGQCPDLAAIKEIAQEYKLPIIEDAAQSFGATHYNKRSCNITTIGCTSFFPAKPLGCYGDGGACFTNDDSIAQKLRSLRVHGKGEDKYDNIAIGMNSRLDTIQAAILLEKLAAFPTEIEQRQEIAANYTSELQSHFETPKVMANNTSVWAQYCLRSKDRDRIIAKLSERNIPTAIYYGKAIHQQTALQSLGYSQGSFPVAETTALEIMSIPMHPYISPEEFRQITSALVEI